MLPGGPAVVLDAEQLLEVVAGAHAQPLGPREPPPIPAAIKRRPWLLLKRVSGELPPPVAADESATR